MVEIIIKNFYVIAGGILPIAFGGYMAYRNNKKNRRAEASMRFSNKVLAELEGLYPVTQHWEQSIFPRFSHSITKIESACAEFRYFIPFYRKGAYDKAIKDYCKYCNEITWESCAGHTMWPEMRKPGDLGPRETFKNIVEHLFSFAKEI